uniref:Helicase superfamily 3 single-stranded DNA/RNA virus domain-containing protein n=1 Tax=uncultured prokaryote TaxID=198431 RepID=A0A0H5Q6I1_9ZZZZ|nr:hypothetical protein [uncultured prokaryote]
MRKILIYEVIYVSESEKMTGVTPDMVGLTPGTDPNKTRATGGKKKAQPKKELKSRIFNCLQYEKNPKTGADLHFTEANILKCVAHKSITRYAYIRHDKDVVTEWDVENGTGSYTEADLGQPKGVHWHIVLETAKGLMPVSTIARWLGIPESMVEIPKGRGAFIDCVEYLRHSDIRQELKGKYVYEADEVKANFDWQTEVTEMVLRKTKYERPLSQADFLKNEVLYNGMRLAEVQERYPSIYMKEQTVFDRLRMKYLVERAPLPASRINFYIEGLTGYGKDTMARSIARGLFPELAKQCDEDVYFEIGGKKVTFDSYDGQPVIIWSEFRAETFVNALGGYEEVLGAIDIIPKNNRHHKKFGAVKLINSVNIVTSTEPYAEFLKGLIPESDPDPSQANRRFPLIIPIHVKDFDILINSGYLGADTYRDYTAYKNIVGSFGALARRLNTRPELLIRAESELIKPVIDAHGVVEGNLHHDEFKGMSDEEILDVFRHEGYGIEKTYRDKTEDELKAEYQTYLKRCYENDKASCKAYTDTYNEWLGSYWVNECMPYEVWLSQTARKICDE